MKHPRAKPVPRVPGRALLAKWFESDPRRTRAALGDRLGITGQAVSGWLRGVARPDEGRMRDLLQHATGIPAETWMTARERTERAAELARARGDSDARPTGTDA